jgi:hypothetical protein
VKYEKYAVLIVIYYLETQETILQKMWLNSDESIITDNLHISYQFISYKFYEVCFIRIKNMLSGYKQSVQECKDMI